MRWKSTLNKFMIVHAMIIKVSTEYNILLTEFILIVL